MGLADTWLKNKRKRRELVKFTLIKEEIILLNLVLREPEDLRKDGGTPYTTTDKVSRKEFKRLVNWFEQSVCTCLKNSNGEVTGYRFPIKIETALPKSAIERLLAILEHYKIAIGKPPHVSTYVTLEMKLNGETDNLDDLNELVNYKEPEPEKK